MNSDFVIDKVKSIKLTLIEEDKQTEIFCHNVIPNTTSMYLEQNNHIDWVCDGHGKYFPAIDGWINLRFCAQKKMIDGEEVLFTVTQTDLESADTLYEDDCSEIESFLSSFRIKEGE